MIYDSFQKPHSLLFSDSAQDKSHISDYIPDRIGHSFSHDPDMIFSNLLQDLTDHAASREILQVSQHVKDRRDGIPVQREQILSGLRKINPLLLIQHGRHSSDLLLLPGLIHCSFDPLGLPFALITRLRKRSRVSMLQFFQPPNYAGCGVESPDIYQRVQDAFDPLHKLVKFQKILFRRQDFGKNTKEVIHHSRPFIRFKELMNLFYFFRREFLQFFQQLPCLILPFMILLFRWESCLIG